MGSWEAEWSPLCSLLSYTIAVEVWQEILASKTDITTYFRHHDRGFSSCFSADPIEAMKAKGQASNIINAAKNSRMGNRVKVMKTICKIKRIHFKGFDLDTSQTIFD